MDRDNPPDAPVPAPPPLRDNEDAPEIYADNYVGLTFGSGNLKLTFATTRADHSVNPATNYRKVVLRLTLPVSMLPQLSAQMGHVLKELQNKGFIKAPAPALTVVE